MPNHSVDQCRRTKCSGMEGHTGWMWYTVMCLVSFPCVLGRGTAAVAESDVSIYPDSDVYVQYGDNLELYCTTASGRAEDLMFTYSGKPLEDESEIFNSTAIRLLIVKPEKHARHTYYCKNKKIDKNALISVIVASPPANVTDFKCISKNFDVLNCSWTTPDLIMETNYTLTFQIHGTLVKPMCEVDTVDTLKKYCIWNTNSTPRYRQQERTFLFYLISQNRLGRNEEYFTIDHFTVVKPDQPKNFYNVSVGPHSVLLHWNIPNNIHDFLKGGIEHKIEYQIAKIDDTSYFRHVNTTSLPINNKTYWFNLTDLPYAHMQYGIRVYIKPIVASDEFWSDFSNLVIYTASEIPRRPPDIAAGGFIQNKFDTYRVIRVYWKQLEEYEEAGANFSYKILVNTDILEPDKSKGLGFIEFEASLNATQVLVWSKNEKGTSDNSSYLYIPPEREIHSLDLTSFTNFAYENGTYELSWFGIENIDNYTLFWCQHNTTCNGRIDFTVLGPKKTKHVINLSRDYRYQFAMSANKGTRTSGMTWATCDMSKDEITMYRFPIIFTDHDAPTKSSVGLRWSMDCILKEGMVIGYNISYCPVVQTSSLCDKSGKNQSKYIDDPHQMNTTIENLAPYRTYQFTIALNTIYGLKTIENTTVRITTVEDTPTSPRNVAISDVRNDSLVLSWDIPAHLNGHVSKYKVYNFNKRFREFGYKDGLRRREKVDGLEGFTNYSLSIQACNLGIDACSDFTPPISLRTCIGSPSTIKLPIFKYSPDLLTWKPPETKGGIVDQYQIKIIKDDKELELVNTTNLSYPITQCEGTMKIETYEVRAVNFDNDLYHGAAAISEDVSLPTRDQGPITMLAYAGNWSDKTTVNCSSRSDLFLVFIIMGVLAMIGVGCGILKVYKKLRKMRDIKPEFPKGLFVAPEKDNKYPFSGLYQPDKDGKPTSDETLLLPNSKPTVSTTDIKQKDSDNNCGSSDHTDSTVLSDASQGHIERQNSTSDDDSQSSLHLESEPSKGDNNEIQEQSSSNSDTESSRENSPYFSDSAFKKNNATGYVQPVVNHLTGYVQSAPSSFKNPPPNTNTQPSGSSYVMAGLPQAMYPSGITAPISNLPPLASGYVRPEDAQRSAMNFPKLGPSPTKIFGPESLPTMPTLLPPTKNGADNSYIQLQSLDSLPSHKPTIGKIVPFKAAVSGYVSPEDPVINKHLKNIMSGGQLSEESAILDPAMSPDAYCRFSWSTDPANDNLHSLLGNSPTMNSSKN